MTINNEEEYRAALASASTAANQLEGHLDAMSDYEETNNIRLSPTEYFLAGIKGYLAKARHKARLRDQAEAVKKGTPLKEDADLQMWMALLSDDGLGSIASELVGWFDKQRQQFKRNHGAATAPTPDDGFGKAQTADEWDQEFDAYLAYKQERGGSYTDAGKWASWFGGQVSKGIKGLLSPEQVAKLNSLNR